MPRGQGANTPTRPIRIDPQLWDQFGQCVGAKRRSEAIRNFIIQRVAEELHTERREDERSLWLNIAAAAKVVQDPETVIERARQRLRQLRNAHAHGRSDKWLDRWQEILENGPHAMLEAMTARNDEAQALRSSSPIPTDLLTDEERTAVLNAFRAHWRSQHRQAA